MNNIRLAMLGAAAAALAYNAPSLAQQSGGEQVVEEVEIVHADHGDGHAAKPGEQKVEKIVKRHRTGAGSADRAALEAKCGARKFETSAVSGADNDKHQSKIKLCGAAGESDAAWAKSLNDALARLEANSELPPEHKAKMVADLKAEIARLN